MRLASPVPALLVGVVMATTLHAADVDRPTSVLHGDLAPGPWRVGLTRMTVRDRSRPEGPASAIEVHVWYPVAAADQAGTPLSVADYLTAHLRDETDAAARATLVEQRVAMFRRMLSAYGTLDEATFNKLLAERFLAVRDAAPAHGRFPLLIGHLRQFATTITNEHLASHGYVVAYVSGEERDETPDAGRALDVGVRDMESAIAALRDTSYVDQAALGALGFSGAGFSQILLAMRHPDVAAVCDLESAIFDDRVMWPLHRGWGYDVAALRVPFLHTYSVPLSLRENRRADFEAMRYSTRYHYLVDAPGITHGDFATEGMLASLVPGLRGAQATRTRQAFETTTRYVRAFFDAHVKKDAAARAFLEGRPEANGVPEGLVTMRVLPAIVPAMTADAFTAIVGTDGLDAAMQALRADRARDPLAPLFLERSLNALGYRFFRSKDLDTAIAVVREAVESYAGSPNAYDSLSEVLVAAGRTEDARAVVRMGLDVAAAPSVSPGDREAFTRMLRERMTRLGG